MLQGLFGNVERGFHRPTQRLFGQTDFLRSQRLAVCGRGILLVRTAEADVCANLNQRGAVRLFPGGLERESDRVDVVAVINLLDMPANAEKRADGLR